MRTQNLDELVNSNFKNILKVLKNLQMTRVELRYEGSGDSGFFDQPIFYYLNSRKKTVVSKLSHDELDTHTVEYARHRSSFDHESKQWIPVVSKSIAPLTEAVSDLANDFLVHHHGGWENNEGGYGSVTIDVTNSTMSLDHKDYILEIKSYEHQYSLSEE